jgi:hypothetical protein
MPDSRTCCAASASSNRIEHISDPLRRSIVPKRRQPSRSGPSLSAIATQSSLSASLSIGYYQRVCPTPPVSSSAFYSQSEPSSSFLYWPVHSIFWDPSPPGPSRRRGGDPIHLRDSRTTVTGVTPKWASECVAATSYPPTRRPRLLTATVGGAAMLFQIAFCNKQLPGNDRRLGSINRRATLDRRSSLVGCPAVSAVHRG